MQPCAGGILFYTFFFDEKNGFNAGQFTFSFRLFRISTKPFSIQVSVSTVFHHLEQRNVYLVT